MTFPFSNSKPDKQMSFRWIVYLPLKLICYVFCSFIKSN